MLTLTFFTLYIHTYIRKNSSFALNLTFSNSVEKQPSIIQESCLITRKPHLINVLSFPDLYYIDTTLSTSLNLICLIFMWTIIQESCRFTEKTSHIIVFHYCCIPLRWMLAGGPYVLRRTHFYFYNILTYSSDTKNMYRLTYINTYIKHLE